MHDSEYQVLQPRCSAIILDLFLFVRACVQLCAQPCADMGGLLVLSKMQQVCSVVDHFRSSTYRWSDEGLAALQIASWWCQHPADTRYNSFAEFDSSG